MLKSEFVKEIRAYNPNLFPNNVIHSDNLWEAITGLYISDELDSVCTGPNRHERFAGWCIRNTKRVEQQFALVQNRNQVKTTANKIAIYKQKIRKAEKRLENEKAVQGVVSFLIRAAM